MSLAERAVEATWGMLLVLVPVVSIFEWVWANQQEHEIENRLLNILNVDRRIILKSSNQHYFLCQITVLLIGLNVSDWQLLMLTGGAIGSDFEAEETAGFETGGR